MPIWNLFAPQNMLAGKIISLWGPATAATPSFARVSAHLPFGLSRIQFRKGANRERLSMLRFKQESWEGDVILRSNSFGRSYQYSHFHE